MDAELTRDAARWRLIASYATQGNIDYHLFNIAWELVMLLQVPPSGKLQEHTPALEVLDAVLEWSQRKEAANG